MTYASRPDIQVVQEALQFKVSLGYKTNPVSKQPVLETSSVIELTQHEQDNSALRGKKLK